MARREETELHHTRGFRQPCGAAQLIHAAQYGTNFQNVYKRLTEVCRKPITTRAVLDARPCTARRGIAHLSGWGTVLVRHEKNQKTKFFGSVCPKFGNKESRALLCCKKTILPSSLARTTRSSTAPGGLPMAVNGPRTESAAAYLQYDDSPSATPRGATRRALVHGVLSSSVTYRLVIIRKATRQDGCPFETRSMEPRAEQGTKLPKALFLFKWLQQQCGASEARGEEAHPLCEPPRGL